MKKYEKNYISMLQINKNDNEKYETIDPYIRQTLKGNNIIII